MLSKPKSTGQLGFFATFEEQLNRSHPLYQLANKIDWNIFESSFSKHYSLTHGKPSKPIRLMVALLILKQIRNLSDESIVEHWSENSYYQYFSGEQSFCPKIPCVPTELVEFRKRIGSEGVELIFKESIRVNGTDSDDPHLSGDTTVQEKNITYPTDDKLHKKIISKCQSISVVCGVTVSTSRPLCLRIAITFMLRLPCRCPWRNQKVSPLQQTAIRTSNMVGSCARPPVAARPCPQCCDLLLDLISHARTGSGSAT